MRRIIIDVSSTLILGAFFGVTLFLLSALLTGCETPPKKPVVEIGGIDYPRQEIIAGLSDGSDAVHREPLSSYDKATCFNLEAWESFKLWVKLLEAYADRCYKAGQKFHVEQNP